MKGTGDRAWHRPGTAARLAEAGLGMGPGPPGLHEGGVGGWRPAQPEGTGSSLINRMIGADGRAARDALGTSLPLPSRQPGQWSGGRDTAGLW